MIRALALMACLFSQSAWAAWDIDALMAALSGTRVTRVTFVERKFFAMLDAPVTSSGELLFTAPDRLERRTLKPRPESVVLDGSTMTMVRGQKQMVLRLQDYPSIAALTESMRATLAGDRAALERHFVLKLQGDAAAWTLLLVPREARTRALVLLIKIEGERGEVRTVEIEQSDKDRSVMTIQKAATQ